MLWDMKVISMHNISSGHMKVILLLAVLTLTASIYAYLPQCDFILVDDKSYVVDNPDIRDFSSEGIQKIALSFFHEELPATLASFAIDYKLWGLDPGPYHVENIAFHLLNVLLVFFLIYLLFQRYEVALLTALFFGIHPYRVESVAWITERKDMLYAFFYLLGLISYIFYVRKKFKIHFLILALFFFSLSLMSKTAALVFPFVLFLIDYVENRKMTFQAFFEKAPFFFIVAIFLWIHRMVSFATSQIVYGESGLDLTSRIFMGFYAFSYYVLGSFVPYNFSLCYIYPDVKNMSGLPLIYYFSPIFVLCFLWGMDRLIKGSQEDRKKIVFGFLFFLCSIGLVLHLMPIGGVVVVAERYAYMAYLGLFFLASHLFVKFMENPRAGVRKIKVLLCFLLVGYVAFFSLATVQRCKVWKNSLLFLNEVIEKNPNWSSAYTFRATEKEWYGDNKGAAEDYEKSIQLASDRPELAFRAAEFYFQRAVFRRKLQDYPGAIADLTKAIELAPDLPAAYCERGAIREELGNHADAIVDFSKAIALNPNRSESYSGRGSVKASMQDLKGALLDYSMAIRLAPSRGLPYFDRGTLYLSQERFDEALDDFNQAVKLDPQIKGPYFNRAVCYFHKNEYAKAWEDIHEVQRTGEELPEQFLKELGSKMQEPKTDPLRVKGVLVFFVPRQLAQPMNRPKGFSVKKGMKFISMSEADTLIDFVLRQGRIVQGNGIWLVGADPKFYSEEDERTETGLRDSCQKKHIPLFEIKINNFSKGWKRLA